MNIVPYHLTEKYLQGALPLMRKPYATMALTHLVLKYPQYTKAMRDFKGYKVLDNSLIELGDAMSMDNILEAAEIIEADEIILPDAFLNNKGTIERVEIALNDICKRNLPYNIMAVAQGKNLQEWADCFATLESIHEIDVIGIPKVLAKIFPAGRKTVESIWVASHKTIHLLGLWYSLVELDYLGPDFRSMDTVMATYLYKNGLEIDEIRPDGHTIDLENCKVLNEVAWEKYVGKFTMEFECKFT